MAPIKKYLIFKDADKWYARFMKHGFVHVMILECDGYNWIAFNPMKSHYDWRILSINPEDDPFKRIFKGCKIIRMEPNFKKRQWLGRPGISNCVSMAKYHFSIRSWSFTPWQLYKYVLKNKLGVDHGRI